MGVVICYLLLVKGIYINSSISWVEEGILVGVVLVKYVLVEGYYVMINGLCIGVVIVIGGLFWLWIGWIFGVGCMVMIVVVMLLVM